MGVATLAVVASACLPPAPPPVVQSSPSIVAVINTHRGVPQLAVNDSLTNLAADWANHLATIGSTQHRNLSSVPGWNNLGETIVQASCGISDATVVNLWLNSPSHATILLSPVYTQAGVARACAADGREWIVANFGS